MNLKEGFCPTFTGYNTFIDYNLRVRDKMYDVMLEHIDWNKGQEEGFHDLYWCIGDYEINLRLIDYVKLEVEYVNTNEKEQLGMFDLESIDLI